jgi:spermidine synthase
MSVTITAKHSVRVHKIVLIVSIFIAGLCSILYELLVSTISSYFLGDSVKQFSITIGVYMAAMGVGSFLSRYFKKDLLLYFILVEIVLGLVGGLSVPILYWVYANSSALEFQAAMIVLISMIGILTGLEVPFLTRLMRKYFPLNENLSNILSLDYFGALAATLLFPFLFLPWMGTFQTSLFFGALNIGLGFLNLWYFSDFLSLNRKKLLVGAASAMFFFLISLLVISDSLIGHWQKGLFKDPIVYSKQTPYQQLVLTRGKEDVRLYINGVIQFSSLDEYRYHETLVHIPMSLTPQHERVLILGGGEGLALREVLRYPGVKQVDVVDIDPEMFVLATTNPDITALNAHSFADPRVRQHATDAYLFLRENEGLYDLIIGDLPDPTTDALTKLYSREFYELVYRRLGAYGTFVTQATSPFHSHKAYWCIGTTLEAAGFQHLLPFHTYVPSFGDWGFHMASKLPLDSSKIRLQLPHAYLEEALLPGLFYFDKDIQAPAEPLKVSTLDKPTILDYYLADWHRWGFQAIK